MRRYDFSRSSQLRVLLAEDDDALRAELSRVLADDGAIVAEARDGLEAADRLANDGPFDAIVTDVRMPGKTGLEVLRELRAKGVRTPAIVMTGFGDGLWASQGLGLEGAFVFAKPFDLDDLRTAVQNLDVAQSPSSRRARTVMVAEDDDELRKLVVQLLRAEGYRTYDAGDGRAMLAALTAASRGEIPMPDLVVMDVRMPRCSGLDVLRALRLADWDVPVVLMTAFPDDNVLKWAAELRASCTLEKPFDARDLARAADILCEVSARKKLQAAIP
jgi:CheY-like chemotaxis protein